MLSVHRAKRLLYNHRILQKFLCRTDLALDLKSFASEKSAQALLLMFLHTVPNTDNIIRELVVYSTHHNLQQQVSHFICPESCACILAVKLLNVRQVWHFKMLLHLCWNFYQTSVFHYDTTLLTVSFHNTFFPCILYHHHLQTIFAIT